MAMIHVSGPARHVVLCALTSMIALMASASARIFYVATDGDNGYPGTYDFPWRTISYAVGSSSGIAAGDTILIRVGNYPEAVTPEVSGESLAPIVLSNYPNEVVTLDPGRIRFNDCIDYWIVNGLIFLNSTQSGLRVTGTHEIGFLVVTNCTFSHHRENGVALGGPDFGALSIEDCTIEWNGEENGMPSGIEGTGVAMYGGYGILWARRNYIAHNWAKGIAHGTATEWRSSGSVIDSNIIIDSFESGMDWWGDSSFIRYNYFSGNGVRDPESLEWGDKGLALDNVATGNVIAFNVIKSSGRHELGIRGSYNYIYNNTLIKDHYYTTVPGSPYAATMLFFAANGPGNEFRNNIIMNLCSQPQHHFAIIAETYLRYIEQIWSNNLYWCPNATDTFPANRPFKLYNFPGGIYVTLEQIQSTFPDQEIGSLWDDPDFVSYPDSNFQLSLGSPAIDAGVFVGYPYNGDAPDIGAFEYRGEGIDEWIGSEDNNSIIHVYPNPFVTLTHISFGKEHPDRLENSSYGTGSAECIELQIYDITGRVVKDFSDQLSVVWDGKDNNGYALPVGIYFCRLEKGTASFCEKIIKLE